jgi:hypothetical protein
MKRFILKSNYESTKNFISDHLSSPEMQEIERMLSLKYIFKK